jgi:hypothetical protein
MSDTRLFRSNKPDISCFAGIKIDSVLPCKGTPGTFENRRAIDYDSTIAYKLWRHISGTSGAYRNLDTTLFGEPYRSELRRFNISLDAYFESNNPVLSREFLENGLLQGPRFAETLKRIRTKSFITTCELTPCDFPDWWKEIPSYKINDIGDIFNYQYCFHWKEETEDYLEGWNELNINSEILDEFRVTLIDLLESIEFEGIDPREVLLRNSGSSIIDDNFKSNKIFEIKGKKNFNFFSEKRGVSKRSVIQVSPQGARDAVINQLSDLNTIQLIEGNVSKLLQENFSSNVVERDLNLFEIRYTKFQKRHKHFLCRDFRKEGITKPRELLLAMHEILNNKWKKEFPFPEFYKEYNFIVNNEVKSPPRGHGLGMANALTTLMQIVLHKMANLRLERISNKNHMLTHNDDCIIGFSSKLDFELYWEAEEDIAKGLGLMVNPKKSFFGRGGVFLEKYFHPAFPFLSKKESYVNRELLMALSASNIVQAKQIVSSLTFVEEKSIVKYLREIVTYWGFEFFKEEYQYPASVGGWYNESIFGVSLDLKRLEELPYDEKIYKAYQACKFDRIKPKPKNNKVLDSWVNTWFDAYLIEDKYQKIFNIGTWDDMNDLYGRLRYRPYFYVKSWESLRRKRLKTFNSFSGIPFEDFLKIFCQESKKDFIPLENMIEKTCRTAIFNGDLKDRYQSKNPLLAYLSYLKEIPDVKPNGFAIEFIDDTVNTKLSADARKRLQRVVSPVAMNRMIHRDENIIPLEDEDWFLIQESYITPLRFLRAWAEIETCYYSPILKQEYKPVINKRKTEVFGRLLNLEETTSNLRSDLWDICVKYKLNKDSKERFLERVRIEEEILNKPIEAEIVSEEIVLERRAEQIEKFAELNSEDYEAWKGNPQGFTGINIPLFRQLKKNEGMIKMCMEQIEFNSARNPVLEFWNTIPEVERIMLRIICGYTIGLPPNNSKAESSEEDVAFDFEADFDDFG